MPRPSNETLMKRLGQCTYRLGVLSTDEEWNITSRKALPFALEDEAESARWVVLVRFHTTALKGAEESLNGSIRRVVNVRAPEALVRARFNSREALFILSEDPEGFRAKIQPIIRNEKLSASVAFVPYSGSLEYDHARASNAMFSIIIEEQTS